jgi:hypothetical protein
MPGGVNKRVVFFIPMLTAIISMLALFLALLGGWFGEPEGVGAQFCEAARDGLIKQPANTWSNAAFIIVGLVVASSLAKGTYGDWKNSLTQNTFYAVLFACIVVLLGPGSMAMHATMTGLGGFLDVISMYFMASFMAAYAIQRFFRLQLVHFIMIFSGLVAACVWAEFQPYRILLVSFGNTVFAMYIGIAAFVETLNTHFKRVHAERRWGYMSLAFLLLAFLFWNLSVRGVALCDPASLLQGHALWHLLCAVAAYFLFLYYVKQSDAPSQVTVVTSRSTPAVVQ